MKLNVVNEAGKSGSEMQVSDAVFGCAFNESLVHQVVIAYQANARAGTRKQKTRSEVRGGGRKPWRQKGTGQARAGTIRSPLWRGGGKIFPSTPDENFSQKVNRKMHRGAMRAILSELVRQNRIVAVSEFKVAQPKTKALVEMLNRLNSPDVLIVTDSADNALLLAARNLHKVDVCTVSGADPVSLIRHEKVIMTSGALKKFEEMLA
ncbi:MAG: 50S ribosomal protein L4 [Candidatus Muproteobacteria bacterium RBG_16_64_10]|uniref:Large ribosomal subunit protein uL4 n=1 Tax=Candidatus Muproteobacteria bacterium RBG_16_64_10 TaxID=1817757 RepID=A0A1F6T7I4_9PROT|nr:MAG: 50S ribosomal protein L4 [Candidatus Muproteobacteria bacterium RBG_16_64_10]